MQQEIQVIKNKITEMYNKDQSSWSSDNDELIRLNTLELKKIVKEFGCIDITRFGEKVSHYAWLIAQHSNHDINFQEYYLNLMIQSSDVLKRDIAFLTDRIAILKGLPQTYGTQFDPKTKSTLYSPLPINDIVNLEQRRKDMGLEPMDEYTEWMRTRV